jgi:hypothetical protein
MKERFITIKEVPLKNNCPECGNNKGLHLMFKQKFIESRFYKSITNETRHTLSCKTCDTVIYPVNWTNDIERVVEYQQRAFVPKETSLKLNNKAWLFIGIAVTAIIIGVVLFIMKDAL